MVWVALFALVVAFVAVVFAWLALCTAQQAAGLADEALDSIALLSMSPDALFVAEDGEEFEFTVDRAN